MSAIEALRSARTVEIATLAAEECRRAEASIMELRDRWIPRDPLAPFFTLGAAAYIDAQYGDLRRYHAVAFSQNAVLRSSFGWLHQRLLDALADVLGARPFFPRRLGLPGFHIFLAHPAFTQPVCSVHVDLQYLHLEWDPVLEVDFSSSLSLTLPLVLPAAGGGLAMWDLKADAQEAAADPQVAAQLVAGKEPEVHRYRPGTVVLHDGLSVHQIAPFPTAHGDRRITLQAHLLRSREGWMLYW
jgi:uncharacterized protein (DUF934 family)